MKRYIFLVLVSCCALLAMAQDALLYTPEDMKAQPGEIFRLPVLLKNTRTLTSIQFVVHLPDGMKLCKKNGDEDNIAYDYKKSTDRIATHEVRIASNVSSNDILVVLYNENLRNISGSDGEILSLMVKVDEGAASDFYSVDFSDIVFAYVDDEESAQGIKQDVFSSQVRIYRTFSVSISSANNTMGEVEFLEGGEVVEENSSVTVAAHPFEGYEFIGWTDPAGLELSAENPYKFKLLGDVTLIANFKEKQYDVIFDVDGVRSIQSLPFGSVIPTPPTPAKVGYTFAGWSPNFIEGATVPVDGITYVAQWSINQYTITFDTDCGSEIAPVTQDYASEVPFPDEPTKEGYTFVGWDKEIPSTMPAEDMTITAQWSINQYTITFDTDGGSEIAPITQDYASEVSYPEEPTKEGYTFVGWDKEIPSTMPAEDMTITAQWSVNQYTITFDTNGGEEMETVLVDYLQSIEISDPQRPYYIFVGWVVKDEDGNQLELMPVQMPALNLVFEAQWELDLAAVKDSLITYLSSISVPIFDSEAKHTYILSECDYQLVLSAIDDANSIMQSTDEEEILVVCRRVRDILEPYKEYCMANGNPVSCVLPMTKEWETLILPFAFPIPEGWHLYTSERLFADGYTLDLDEHESGSAFTPYLVRGNQGECIQYIGHAKEEDLGSVTFGMMTGVLGSSYILQSGDFLLQEKEGQLGFFRVDESVGAGVVNPFHCFLSLPTIDVPFIRWEGIVDGIEVSRHTPGDSDHRIYNLLGQPVGSPKREIIIVNKKKVFIK